MVLGFALGHSPPTRLLETDITIVARLDTESRDRAVHTDTLAPIQTVQLISYSTSVTERKSILVTERKYGEGCVRDTKAPPLVPFVPYAERRPPSTFRVDRYSLGLGTDGPKGHKR